MKIIISPVKFISELLKIGKVNINWSEINLTQILTVISTREPMVVSLK